MSWIEHPMYVPARERLIAHIAAPHYRFRRVAPVLFLCGGALSKARDTLRDYLVRRFSQLGIFYAERVWELIASRGGFGALKMEADLASLADLVVIIVESPGTFTELGAFSLSDPLRKKLLPVVDDSFFPEEKSFIATGPLRWIDRESDFAPTIYVKLTRILEAAGELEERIERIPKRTVRVDDLASSAKHLLFFICDLIAAIHPATLELIQYYLRRIVPSVLSSDIDIGTLISLGIAMGLLRDDTANNGQHYFSPAVLSAVERPYHHLRLISLPSLRAEHVSALITIPEASAILAELGARR